MHTIYDRLCSVVSWYKERHNIREHCLSLLCFVVLDRLTWHIEAETKQSPFRKRYFQMHFF